MIELIKQLRTEIEEECAQLTQNVLNGACGSMEAYASQTMAFKVKRDVWNRLNELIKKGES